MSTDPVASLPPIGLLYNGLYFGAMLSTALYGITCMQTFFYYVHYQNDPMRMKIFVAVLWALNTIHEALSVSGVYKYIISGIVTPSSVMDWNPELALLSTAIVAVPVQGFFVYRIYTFSGRNIIAPLLWVPLAIIQLGSAIVYSGKALYSANGVVHVVALVVQSDYTYAALVTLSLSVAGAVDILIAIFLTFLLARQRDSSCIANTTSHLLQRLVVFAVNTGIWTAAFAFLALILLNLSSINTLYAVPGISLCSVYCNALLANLNARSYIGSREAVNISDVDLDIDFSATPGARVSESAQTDERPRVAKSISPAHQPERAERTTEELTLLNAIPSVSVVSLTESKDGVDPAC